MLDEAITVISTPHKVRKHQGQGLPLVSSTYQSDTVLAARIMPSGRKSKDHVARVRIRKRWTLIDQAL